MGGRRVTDGEQNQRGGGAVKGPDDADRVEGDGTPAEPQRRWWGATRRIPVRGRADAARGGAGGPGGVLLAGSGGTVQAPTTFAQKRRRPQKRPVRPRAVESRRASVDSRRRDGG